MLSSFVFRDSINQLQKEEGSSVQGHVWDRSERSQLMRLLTLFLLTAALLALSGCSRQSGPSSERSVAQQPVKSEAPSAAPKTDTSTAGSAGRASSVQEGEMKQA